MESSKIVGISAAVALVLGVGYVVLDGSGEVIPEGDAVEVVSESKAVFLEDGGKAYRTPVRLRDGGQYFVESAEAPCKRRPRGVDGSTCRHVYHRGGLSPADVDEAAPELVRYRAAEMLGDGCEGVACSVWAGEDPDAEEAPK